MAGVPYQMVLNKQLCCDTEVLKGVKIVEITNLLNSVEKNLFNREKIDMSLVNRSLRFTSSQLPLRKNRGRKRGGSGNRGVIPVLQKHPKVSLNE